jgi:hypothetical protein
MSSEIIFRDAASPADPDANLLLRWENTINTPLVSVEWLGDGEAISDVYTIAATSSSSVNVTADDPKNEVEATGVAVVADGSTWNYGVVPGTRMQLSATMASGWTGKVSIGALMASGGSVSDRFNVGIVEAGQLSTQRRIVAVNVGSEASADTAVWALPGFYLEDDAQPWITFLRHHTDTARHTLATPGTYVITFADYQSGSSPPTADVYVSKDGGGAALAIQDAKLDGATLYQYGSGNGYSDANDALPGLGITFEANGDPSAQSFTFYVRGSYDWVEFAPDVTGSPGSWQSPPITLTESGQTNGTITASGTAYFWFRLNVPTSAAPGDRRLFTLRARGLTV